MAALRLLLHHPLSLAENEWTIEASTSCGYIDAVASEE